MQETAHKFQGRMSDRQEPKSYLAMSCPRLGICKKAGAQSKKANTLPVPLIPMHVNDKHESMLANLLLMMVIAQCVCGVVLPFCDAFALADAPTLFALNHRYYLEAFLIGQYTLAILMLAYLQMLIFYYNRKNLRFEKEQRNRMDSLQTPTDGHQYLPRPTGNLSNVFDDREVVTQPTESTVPDSPSTLPPAHIRTPSLSWDPDGLNLYMRLGAVAFGLGVMIHNGFELSLPWELGKPFCHSLLWVPKHLLRLTWILWQTYFIFKYHRVVFHVHKFAVQLAFSHICVVNLCHWLKTVVSEIASSLNSLCFTTTCIPGRAVGPAAAGGVEAVHTTEVVTTAFVSSGWYNITATTPKEHTVDEFQSLNFGTSHCKGQIGEMLKPFLFPLIIEYSLITGALFYKLLRRVDKNYQCYHSTLFTEKAMLINPKPQSLLNQCQRHYSYRSCLGYRVYLQVNNAEQDQETVTQNPDSEEFKWPNTSQRVAQTSRLVGEDRSCHRSHTGLFFGILFFAACTISVVSLLSRKSSTLSKLSPYILRYVTFIVLSVCILVCLVGLAQTYSLRFRQTRQTDSLEYNLLGIGLLGNLLYHLLLLVPSLEMVVHLNLYKSLSYRMATVAITDTAHIDGYTASIHLAKCILEISEALLQFFFIIVASQLGPCCRNQAAIKPGRSAIVFLLIANLSLWVINTFEVRQETTQLSPYTHYYGVRSWSAMTTFLMPLLIFFRFHSSVCLAQIWSRTYQLN